MFNRLSNLILISALSVCAETKASDEKRDADKKALAPIQSYVGDWKGVGGGRGEAAKDAWGEESEWGYDFKGARAAIVFTAPTGKFFTAGRFEPGEKTGAYTFTGTVTGSKAKEAYSGEMTKDGDLVMLAATPADGRPARITLSLVAKGKRLVTTFERQVRKGTYAPVAELGLTRKGSGFGKDVDMRECVVTGGTGKSAVQYKGQTYYVCCGGCLDEFNDNPDKVMASWKKRKDEQRAK